MLIGGEKIADEERVYRKIGDRATDMPSAVYFGSKETGMYALNEHVKYAYDEKGNIQKIFENGEMTVRYGYDTLGRLVREDNKKFGKTWLYTYDNNGNILLKRETDFTLKTNVEELTFTKKSYAYDGNKLVSYNGETCAYDGLGNPTIYRGKVTAFTMGGYLTKYGTTAFTYDMQGRRLTKNALSFTYDSNGKLIAQSDGLRFLYDHTGVVGLKYNDSVYVYRKDAQGNIIAILDDTGKVVVRYAYDAWGKHTVEDISGIGLGNLNPFRYRGYYYDVATGLYYLNTRYYDPETGRFISPDGIEYLDPDTINGLNLYAYCGNDPVNRIDPNGNFWFATLFVSMLIGGFITGTTKAVVEGIQDGTWRDIMGAFVGGFITGAFLSGSAVFGGMLAVGTIVTTPLTVLGSLAFSIMGSFIGGIGAYFVENTIKGNNTSWELALKNGVITAIQGLFNFGIGIALGGAGLWETLKEGEGFTSYIKGFNQIALMEIGRTWKTNIASLFYGGSSYLSLNFPFVLLRTFYRQIFSAPWDLLKE